MPPDLDEYRRSSLDSWDRFAGNWERERDFLRDATGRLGQRLVERLDPAARRDGPRARGGDRRHRLPRGRADRRRREADLDRLRALDGRGRARRRASHAASANVECRVLDAERMDLDDSSVDGVLCRFGYMLMADPAAALSETRRVLRDGGRLSFAVWAAPDRNLWAVDPGADAWSSSATCRRPSPAPGDLRDGRSRIGSASWSPEPASANRRSRRSRSSGATPIPTCTGTRPWQLAAPIAEAFGSLSEEDQEAVRSTVRERVTERLAEGSAALDGVALAVLAE